MFKKLTCSHTFVQTKLTKYDPIFGGHTKFICLTCHKNKWIYTPSLDYVYEEQRVKEELGIKLKVRYIKEVL